MKLAFFDFEKAFKGADDQVKMDQFLFDQGQKQYANDLKIQEAEIRLQNLIDLNPQGQAAEKARLDYLLTQYPEAAARLTRQGTLDALAQPGREASTRLNSDSQVALSNDLSASLDSLTKARAQQRRNEIELGAINSGTNLIDGRTRQNNAPLSAAAQTVEAGNRVESGINRAGQIAAERQLIPTQAANTARRAEADNLFGPAETQLRGAKLARDAMDIINSVSTPTEKQQSAQIVAQMRDTLAIINDPTQLNDLAAQRGVSPEELRAQLLAKFKQDDDLLQSIKYKTTSRASGGAGGTTSTPAVNPLLQRSPVAPSPSSELSRPAPARRDNSSSFGTSGQF